MVGHQQPLLAEEWPDGHQKGGIPYTYLAPSPLLACGEHESSVALPMRSMLVESVEELGKQVDNQLEN